MPLAAASSGGVGKVHRPKAGETNFFFLAFVLFCWLVLAISFDSLLPIAKARQLAKGIFLFDCFASPQLLPHPKFVYSVMVMP